MKLLIVDDSDLIRREIINSLEKFINKNNILAAENLQKGFSLLKEKPDAIIIDISLPDGSGFDLLSKAKQDLQNVVTIILTNYPDEQFRTKAQELGSDYFFDKSTEFSHAINTIEALFAKIEVKDNLPKETNILVTDDSSIMRKMIISSLNKLDNVNFVEAENGLEAIEKLAIMKFDLLTLDLNMPDMHGLEVIEFIRSHSVFTDLPIVVVTTKTDSNTLDEVMGKGVNLLINKPFKPEELYNKIKKLLG